MIAELVQQGLQAWWAPGLAFAAGVVSCASPCVLPLIPGYVAFVTGGRSGPSGDRRPVVPILLFVLGFSIVFTLIGGFTASAVSRWLRSTPGQRVAGVVVVGFGLLMLLYALRLSVPWLYREERPLLARIGPGPGNALPLGMAFAVGWTPCIGPVLGGILTLAAAQGGAIRAASLLFFYSMGLGVPILLIGVGVSRLSGCPEVLQPQLPLVRRGQRPRHGDDRDAADQRPMGSPALAGAQARRPVHSGAVTAAGCRGAASAVLLWSVVDSAHLGASRCLRRSGEGHQLPRPGGPLRRLPTPYEVRRPGGRKHADSDGRRPAGSGRRSIVAIAVGGWSVAA